MADVIQERNPMLVALAERFEVCTRTRPQSEEA
jgi:hypothetical protein